MTPPSVAGVLGACVWGSVWASPRLCRLGYVSCVFGVGFPGNPGRECVCVFGFWDSAVLLPSRVWVWVLPALCFLWGYVPARASSVSCYPSAGPSAGLRGVAVGVPPPPLDFPLGGSLAVVPSHVMVWPCGGRRCLAWPWLLCLRPPSPPRSGAVSPLLWWSAPPLVRCVPVRPWCLSLRPLPLAGCPGWGGVVPHSSFRGSRGCQVWCCPPLVAWARGLVVACLSPSFAPFVFFGGGDSCRGGAGFPLVPCLCCLFFVFVFDNFFPGGGFACSSLCLPWASARTGRHLVWLGGSSLVLRAGVGRVPAPWVGWVMYMLGPAACPGRLG